MENKTYEQRLAEIATQFATVTHGGNWSAVQKHVRSKWIENHKPLAAIALKHMAEEHRNGFLTMAFSEDEYKQELADTGLVPQNKINEADTVK